jgi:hypothetical protein
MLLNLTTWTFPLYYPYREEGVLRIFISFKNASPWLGFEPLGPVASTLTTTPLLLKIFIKLKFHDFNFSDGEYSL